MNPLDSDPKIRSAKVEANAQLEAMPGNEIVPLRDASVVREATCKLNGVTNEIGSSPR